MTGVCAVRYLGARDALYPCAIEIIFLHLEQYTNRHAMWQKARTPLSVFMQYRGVCSKFYCGPVSLFRGRENSFRSPEANETSVVVG